MDLGSKSPMGKFYKTLEGKIEHLQSNGAGVIVRDGKKEIMVHNTLPGEKVRVITKRGRKGQVEADVEEILERSPERIDAICPYAATCGGCKWQHATYEFQVKQKTSFVEQAFKSAGLPLHVSNILPCPEPFYYRNRMDFAFGRNGELGLKAAGKWWETLDLKTCFLLSKNTPEILSRVRAWSHKTELPFWNSKDHAGFFRYLIIREGKNTGERLILIITSDQHALSNKQKSELIKTLDKFATSILIGINSTMADISTFEKIEVLKGTPFLHESINGLRYRIQPLSFFQTNSIMAARLQNVVLEACGDLHGKKVLDLYCGAGFFTLALAKSGAITTGIELDEKAIEAAKQNANLNKIKEVEFLASKAEEYDWAHKEPDVVIVDPPRSGLHPSVLETLTLAKPSKIVYVSCKYQRLVQELPLLLPFYDISKIQALDLFPQTPHIELVVELTKKVAE